MKRLVYKMPRKGKSVNCGEFNKMLASIMAEKLALF